MLKESQAYAVIQLSVDQAAESCAVDVGLARALAALLAICMAAKVLIVACRSETLCCCALLLVLHALYHAKVSLR